MSSINTNLSAMTALQALKSTQSAMNKNQNQISTGLRVGEASHNASYWSISTQMKSDNGALGAVKDSIKQSKAMINTFTAAMDKSLTYLNKMKEGLVAASQPGADKAKIQTEFKANIEGMKSAAGSASFNGQNWLAQATAATVNLVTSYDGVNNKVGTLAIDTSKTNLFTNASNGTGGLLGDAAAIDIGGIGTPGVAGKVELSLSAFGAFADGGALSYTVEGGTAVTLNFSGVTGADANAKLADVVSDMTKTGITAVIEGTGSAAKLVITSTDATKNVTASFTPSGGSAIAGTATPKVAATTGNTDVATALATIDAAIAKVTEGSAMLGANKALLETQEEFIGVLSDSLTAGVSAFIDADMNEASTRNQALQTQQQLGVQALSMANQNSQMILKLFQ